MRSFLPRLFLLLVLACAGSVCQAGPAGEPAIWSGLLLATNEDHPKDSPPELRKYQEKLDNIFGYNQFELVGEQTRKMRDSAEHWLVPSKDFCLHVDTHAGPSGAAYRMKLELFEDTHLLAEFETRLGANSPLFIRGPLYAGGQLIIVLVVKEPAR